MRSTRGLKNLTTLVKQLTYKRKRTSFKEVALDLIDELVDARGYDRVREEKNVRRRVYDAINVLIAAGVLQRDGKDVSWNEHYISEEPQQREAEVLKKRAAVSRKRKALQDTLN